MHLIYRQVPVGLHGWGIIVKLFYRHVYFEKHGRMTSFISSLTNYKIN